MADDKGNMSREQTAAQVKKLQEHRAQMQNTRQDRQPTSAAKQQDPKGQIRRDGPALRQNFEKAHDHSKGTKTGKQVSPQLRQQSKDAPAPHLKPKGAPPQKTQSHAERSLANAQKVKNRQEAAKSGKMKDGKDHDRTK
ncbi:MAG: hypothetical protein AAF593_00625 [Planctomycetota bacterium]